MYKVFAAAAVGSILACEPRCVLIPPSPSRLISVLSIKGKSPKKNNHKKKNNNNNRDIYFEYFENTK